MSELLNWTVNDFGAVICPDHPGKILILDESTPGPVRWYCAHDGGCGNFLNIATYKLLTSGETE